MKFLPVTLTEASKEDLYSAPGQRRFRQAGEPTVTGAALFQPHYMISVVIYKQLQPQRGTSGEEFDESCYQGC